MNNIKRTIESVLLKDVEKKEIFDIYEINSYLEKINPPQIKNLIILSDKIENVFLLNEKILYINFYNKDTHNTEFTEFLPNEKDNTNYKTELELDTEFLFYIEKKDPISLIKNRIDFQNFFFNSYNNIDVREIRLNQKLLKNTNLDTIYEHTLINGNRPVVIINKNDPILEVTNHVIVRNNMIEEYLSRDIVILKEKNILTSRLAITIYRKAMLNINANKTEIGRFFNKHFGKSKSIDLKKISQSTSTDYEGLSKTIVKAYYLSNRPKSEQELKTILEKEIKIHIAKKLLYFTDIDEDTVLQIVELPKIALKSIR